MIKITEVINKFRNFNNQSNDQNNLPTKKTHPQQNNSDNVNNWYNEKFDNVITQRNVLLVLLIILLCLSTVAIGAITYILNTRSFDPFVIQIDDITGTAKIVNPIDSEIITGNEALAQYFIKKYTIARETYNPVDFSTTAKQTIRMLSTNSIYWEYIGYLKNDLTNPSIQYGQKNTTYLLVKSWSQLNSNKYIFRFSINETSQGRRVYNKIALVEFQYIPMKLTEKEKDINPLGFQVTGYRVDDDSS